MSSYVTHSSRKEVTTAACPIRYTHTSVISLRLMDIGVCALEWWYPYMCVTLTSLSQIPRSWGFNVSAVCALVVVPGGGEGGGVRCFCSVPGLQTFYLHVSLVVMAHKQTGGQSGSNLTSSQFLMALCCFRITLCLRLCNIFYTVCWEVDKEMCLLTSSLKRHIKQT